MNYHIIIDSFKATRKHFINTICILSVILMFISFISPCLAWSYDGNTVRVGFFPLGRFQYYDSAGKPAGYNVEYLNKIAENTHWKYEYVPCNNWVEGKELLRNGEIDLLAPAQSTPALQSEFDYAAYQMGVECAALYSLADRDDLIFEDFDNFDSLTFGGSENSTFLRKFKEEYCVSNNFSPEIKEYSNMTDLLNALQTGEIDVAVTNILFASDEYKLLGEFSMFQVYYITHQGNSEILDKLNNSMLEIMNREPNFQIELINRYFSILNDSQFTYNERLYLENAPAITVGYEDDMQPISYTDKNGNFAGIAREILDLISKKTGIPFEYKRLPAENTSVSQLSAAGIDVLCGISSDQAAVYDSSDILNLSKPYFKAYCVLVYKDGEKDNTVHKGSTTMAVTGKPLNLNDSLKAIYPNYIIKEYTSTEECLEAVNSGEADVLMLNSYCVHPYLSIPRFKDMKVLVTQNITDNLCLATINYGEISKDPEIDSFISDPLFISVIDKAISQIDYEELNPLIINSISKTVYHYSPIDIICEYNVMILIIICAIIMLTLLVINRQRTAKTLENKNAQLSKAVQYAEEANGSKSRFLAQMSHEIRTPMNAIIGLTEIARTEKDDPEKVDDYLDKIDRSSRILLGILNDVLDMSAIESDKLKIDTRSFDIRQIADSLMSMFKPQAESKNINISVNVDGISGEHLIGDPLRVSQIIMNLLSNAVKFTPEGGRIELNIITTIRNDNTALAIITVADTGIGISEDMMDRLFKPFEQESAMTASEHGGSGLGLSITKNLVELMNGTIEVRSTPGQGSIFTVNLPFTIDNTVVHIAEKLDFADIKTLIICNDKTDSQHIGVILNQLHTPYEFISESKAALAALGTAEDKGQAFRMCIVDLDGKQGIGTEGVKTVQEIRSIFTDDIVIVLVSARELMNDYCPEGTGRADYFVQKPVHQTSMLQVLTNVSGNNFASLNTADEYNTDNLSGKHILLAEDVELSMEVAVKLLEMANITVDCAKNGREAVEMYINNKPDYYDAILLDINMPVMDGYEAAKRIRNSGIRNCRKIPLYALTANAFAHDLAAVAAAGMNGHIAKPIDTKVLYDTLSRAFDDWALC